MARLCRLSALKAIRLSFAGTSKRALLTKPHKAASRALESFACALPAPSSLPLLSSACVMTATVRPSHVEDSLKWMSSACRPTTSPR